MYGKNLLQQTLDIEVEYDMIWRTIRKEELWIFIHTMDPIPRPGIRAMGCLLWYHKISKLCFILKTLCCVIYGIATAWMNAPPKTMYTSFALCLVLSLTFAIYHCHVLACIMFFAVVSLPGSQLLIFFRGQLHSLWPADVLWRLDSWSLVAQIIACRYVGTKLFRKSMLTYCQLHPQEKHQRNFNQNKKYLRSRKIYIKMSFTQWRSFWSEYNVLNDIFVNENMFCGLDRWCHHWLR